MVVKYFNINSFLTNDLLVAVKDKKTAFCSIRDVF